MADEASDGSAQRMPVAQPNPSAQTMESAQDSPSLAAGSQTPLVELQKLSRPHEPESRVQGAPTLAVGMQTGGLADTAQ